MKAKISLRGMLCLINKLLNKKILLVIFTFLLSISGVSAQQTSNLQIKGTVTSAANNQPLNGATIKIKKTTQITVTNEKGEFSLRAGNGEGTLEISFLGYKNKEISFKTTSTNLSIQLDPDENLLSDVDVVVSTGYQNIPKERATGSFVHIDNKLLNRSVSSDILSRIKGVASGVLFDNTVGTSEGFNIRGRSTIFANTDPLIILDNFPYDGNINNINPNDIESITILKDAAASSIWGVRASNGVVVITTKSGKLNEPVKVSFNSNITVGEKPELFSSKELAPDDLIDIEKFLYEKGSYTNAINSPYLPISPVVQILANQKANKITETEAEQQINALRGHDVRNDYQNHYYRNSVNQQYSLNLNGGGKQNRYYVSAGYDRSNDNLVSNHNDRITINAQNVYNLLNDKLEAGVGINFSSANDVRQSGNILNPSLIKPYSRLIDDEGNHLDILTYKKAWLDTIGGGRLLDWSWKPLDELQRSNNKRTITNYLLNLNLKYTIINGLDISAKYQYGNGNEDINELSSSNSYFTRNQINSLSQINYKTDEVIRPIPLGGILTRKSLLYTSHNLRVQTNYSKKWGSLHEVNAIAGGEVKDYNYQYNGNILYGYDKELGIVAPINHEGLHKNLFSGGSSRISGSPSQSGTTDRYVSVFANALYSYKQRYSLSGSARRDESNLFGVKANQKGVPLWSVGASWIISKEDFFTSSWLPFLKLRATNGYNGNVDKTLSAYVTARVNGINRFSAPFALIINPPNPSLRWEKINMTNIGLDFSMFNNRLSGSVEYYYKTGKDIIGDSPLAPSSGVSTFRGNSADISGNGLDIILNSTNIKVAAFSWTSNLLFSKSTDKIVDYKVNTSALSFHKGYPFNGVFSYRWAGLDPENGNPLGYFNGEVSNDWGRINTADSLGKTTVYSGSGTPVYYGSLRNGFQYKSLSLSFNIVYKLGYYFRASSVNYVALYAISSSNTSHQDYNDRWQMKGDELKTNVPSVVYPASLARDNFYTNSEILVEKGDHLRLQDIQLNYSFSNNRVLKNTNVYLYASNLGLIWSANKRKVDPENLMLSGQRSLAIGIKTNF